MILCIRNLNDALFVVCCPEPEATADGDEAEKEEAAVETECGGPKKDTSESALYYA